MIVRIVYECGRIDVFDTLTFTASAPFGPENMLTEFSVDTSGVEERGLWLTVSWYAARGEYRDGVPDDAIPVARRSKGWRFLLSSKEEVAALSRVELDGVAILERAGGKLLGPGDIAGAMEKREVEEDWGDVDEAGW